MTVRVGCIGAGWVARSRHIPAFRSHPDVQVVAVYDRQSERAASLAGELGIPAHFDDLDALLRQELDIVTICTPPWTHAPLAMAALEQGAHVFTEKPMAMNTTEAEAMVAAADSADRLLCVSHNFLFSRSVQRVDRLLADSQPIQFAFATQLSSASRRLPTWHDQLPGGLFMDEAPHMLYTLQHFLGRLDVEHVRATRDPRTGLPLTVEVAVGGARAPGQVVTVFGGPVSEWHVIVVTPDRVFDLDLFRDIVVSVGSDGAHRPLDILATSARVVSSHAAGFVSSGGRYMRGRLFWGHDVIIRLFVDATRGRNQVPVSQADSLGIVRLTDAILTHLVD
jgi:scyllo-inositol 2-dehydrogenase (NADP+)